MAAYGTGTVKRERRTRARVDRLDQQILDVLAEDHPQSVRHVFYRMTNPRLPEPVEKSDRGYRAVQRRVLELRRAGLLPYGWIADMTRRGYHTDVYKGEADFLRSMKGLYRADIWRNATTYIEVWVESRSIAGVLQDLCKELAVSLYPCGGFASATLAYEAAQYINECSQGRTVVIYYVGDYDPAGVLIDKSLEVELRKHLDPGVNLCFHRLGITEDQIEALDLPTKPRKAGDRRSMYVKETVEAEAMPAATMRHLVRTNIEAWIPERALQVAEVEEESARAFFERVAEIIGQEPCAEGDRR